MKLRRTVRIKDGVTTDLGYMIKCPGCNDHHSIHTEEKNSAGAQWTFDGNMDLPTFTPSVKSSYTFGEDHVLHVCHFNLTKGMLQFHADCTHDLRGQTVPLPEFPEEG